MVAALIAAVLHRIETRWAEMVQTADALLASEEPDPIRPVLWGAATDGEAWVDYRAALTSIRADAKERVASVIVALTGLDRFTSNVSSISSSRSPLTVTVTVSDTEPGRNVTVPEFAT